MSTGNRPLFLVELPSPSYRHVRVLNVSSVKIPLAGRTFERTQGCWNCSALASIETSLAHWKTKCRPAEEARIAESKRLLVERPPDPAAAARAATNRNARCPCGSGMKYKQCHLQNDAENLKVLKAVEGIERAVHILDGAERAISEGRQCLCDEKTSEKYGTFVSDRFLCNRWSPAEGASVARAGAAPDLLPEELRAIHGDGNEGDN